MPKGIYLCTMRYANIAADCYSTTVVKVTAENYNRIIT